MSHVVEVTHILLYYLITIEVASAMITMDNRTCSLNIDGITDDTPKTLLWDGRALLKQCRVRLSVLDNSGCDLVIRTEKFNVVDCDFALSYFYGDTTLPKQKYTCKSTPDTTEGVIYIILQFDTFRASSSSVKLHISANCSNFNFGLLIGSTIFMILVALIIYMLRQKKFRRLNWTEWCCICWCECGRACQREARNTYLYFCSNCGSNCFADSASHQATSGNIPRIGAQSVQALSSRRSSFDGITDPGLVDHAEIEEPPDPPLLNGLPETTPTAPPPPYEDCVRGVPPPCYPDWPYNEY